MEYVNKLERNGVCLIKNIYRKDEITKIRNMNNNIMTNIEVILKKNIPKRIKYVTHFDKEYEKYKNLYQIENLSILELNKGRYDVYLDNEINFKINNTLQSIIDFFFKKNYTIKWGFLASQSNSDEGHWHRDVINIDGDADDNGNYNDSNMVHNMNPFYFTILIPLVNCNVENGSTEFIKSSHNKTYSETDGLERIQFDTEIGDIIIFDGRIFHRGRKNNSNNSRDMIYIIVYRNWYNEQ